MGGRSRKEEIPPGNPKFVQWLEEWLEEARQRDNPMKFCYQKALTNLRKVPNPLVAKSLVQVPGIGPGIVKKMESRVEKHLQEGGTLADLYQPNVELPAEPQESLSQSSTSTAAKKPRAKPNTAHDGMPPPAEPNRATKKPKTKKLYMPTYRSGAYAILMALHKAFLRGEMYLTKTRLQEMAQPYCDSSFKEAEPGKQHYTAWSGMAGLITKLLVVKQGSPAKYYLTGDGQELGELLWSKSREFEGGQTTPTGRSPVQAIMPIQSMPSTSNSIPSLEHARKREAAVALLEQRPEPLQSSTAFQFWYLSTDRRRVRTKDEAEVNVDTQDMRFSFKIEFHSSQENHQLAGKIQRESAMPDASGILVGFLEDALAPEECPGINFALLQMASAVIPHATGLMPPPSTNVINKLSLQTPVPAPVSTGPSPVPIQRTPYGASPMPPANLSSTPLLSKSESLQAAIALNSTDIPDAPPLPKHFSLVPDENQISVSPVSLQTMWDGPPICLPMGQYEIRMLLDSREIRRREDRSYFNDELGKRGVACSTRALEVADAMWIAVPHNGGQEIALDFLVERKRMDDLVSSIKEGRFQEQKQRLLNSGVSNIFYLIEEFDTQTVEQFGKDALRTAMATVQTLTGMFVKRTTGVDDSIRFFAMLTHYIRAFYQNQDIYAIPAHVIEKDTFLELKRRAETRDRRKYHIPYNIFAELCSKSATSTLRDVWFKQLNCIRGVSTEKAQVVVKTYPTPNSLITALHQRKSTDEQISLLRQLNGPVQRKNLGDGLRRKLAELFCQHPYPAVAATAQRTSTDHQE